MWPSQLKRQNAESVGVAAGAGLVTLLLAVLVYTLTGAGTVRDRTMRGLAPVYVIQDPEAADPDEPEDVPTMTREALSAAPPPPALTLNFESPDVTSDVALPRYEVGPLTADIVVAAPQFDFNASKTTTMPSVNVTSTISAAKPTFRVPPQYPMKAKQQGIEGFVTMHLLINREGRVDEVKIVKESPAGVFKQSAVRAVHRWRFAAPEKPEWQRITIRYELDK